MPKHGMCSFGRPALLGTFSSVARLLPSRCAPGCALPGVASGAPISADYSIFFSAYKIQTLIKWIHA